MTTQDSAEIRKFKMHPDLLFSVIQAQAGTQEKALLEAVMNAVDAGATNCYVSITEGGFSVIDNGKGFANRQEIDEFFETFGTPHSEGDAVYGRFRMGRGQLFAFATTKWNTSTFEMKVDIKGKGLDYEFRDNLPFSEGCTIEGSWYAPLSAFDIHEISKNLESLIKYMQIPVFLNERKVSVIAEEQRWDYQAPDFFVKTQKSPVLSVYNMGALVAHYPASRFGVGGVVVTKKALKVNFARNDVLVSECSLWKKIIKKMQEILMIETDKKTLLTDDEREAIVTSVFNFKILAYKVADKGIFKDVSGKKISIKQLCKTKRLSFSSDNERTKQIQQKINDSGQCLVLDNYNLHLTNSETAQHFLDNLIEILKYSNNQIEIRLEEIQDEYLSSREIYKVRRNLWDSVIRHPEIILENINDLALSYNPAIKILGVKELSKSEALFLKNITNINFRIAYIVFNSLNPHFEGNERWKKVHEFQRNLVLGESELYNAWTDGESFIAVNRSQANKDPISVISLLIHEYCHNARTNQEHEHGLEFYKAFHDSIVYSNDDIFLANYSFQKNRNTLLLKSGMKPMKNIDEKVKETEDFISFQIQLETDEEMNKVKVKKEPKPRKSKAQVLAEE